VRLHLQARHAQDLPGGVVAFAGDVRLDEAARRLEDALTRSEG
jgi:hypothetical protein